MRIMVCGVRFVVVYVLELKEGVVEEDLLKTNEDCVSQCTVVQRCSLLLNCAFEENFPLCGLVCQTSMVGSSFDYCL